MKSMSPNNIDIPTTANFVHAGQGVPVIMIHGLAASSHDWDELTPELAKNNYSAYALDILGHGESPKPNSRTYQMDWLFEHFSNWMQSLRLTEPAILIGHSLGGYLALEYARRVSAWTRGLILVNPFYSLSQLPLLVRQTYRHPTLSGFVMSSLPEWMFRVVVDAASIHIGHGTGAIHSLPDHIRAQTALDYTRTAPGAYSFINTGTDLTESLSNISIPTLVVWGDHDQTLAPASFKKMVDIMPRAIGKTIQAGHVPHQSNAKEFNQIALEFLRGL